LKSFWQRFWFKPHILLRDGFVAFDSQQSEKVKIYANREPSSLNHLGAFNLTCFARVCEIFTAVVSESQRDPRVEYRKEKTGVKLIKIVGRVLCQIFQPWRFRLVCLWKLIIMFPAVKYDFNNWASLNAFWVEGSNKRSDRGAL